MHRYLSLFIILLSVFTIFSCSKIKSIRNIFDNLALSSSQNTIQKIDDSIYKNLEDYSVNTNKNVKQYVHDIYLYAATFFFKNIAKILFVVIPLVLVVIIINISLKSSDKKKFLSNTRLSFMDKELKIACNYMEKNFRDPELSVNSICEALVTGPAFLQILFNNELGMSIDDFLAQVRMNRALDIIRNDKNITIDDLILRIGFTNNNDFFNSFEKVTGMSFSDYQKSKNVR